MRPRGRQDDAINMGMLECCPFCGADPRFGDIGLELASNDTGAKAWIVCQKCGGSMSAKADISMAEAQAIKLAMDAWNKRAK